MIFLQTVDFPEAVPPATPIKKGVLCVPFEREDVTEDVEEKGWQSIGTNFTRKAK